MRDDQNIINNNKLFRYVILSRLDRIFCEQGNIFQGIDMAVSADGRIETKTRMERKTSEKSMFNVSED